MPVGAARRTSLSEYVEEVPQAMVGALLAWWLWIPLAYLLWLLVVNVFLGGFGNLHVGTWAWFDRWFAVDSGQRWTYFLVGAVGTLAICVVFSAGEAGTAAAGESVVAVVGARWWPACSRWPVS